MAGVIPVIDLGYLFQQGNHKRDDDDNNNNSNDISPTMLGTRIDDPEICKLADELCSAFRSIGFATLIHHGMDPVLLSNAFTASKQFFALPVKVKEALRYKNHLANRGYIGYGCESFQQETTTAAGPDKKETFDIGKQDEIDYCNEWPSEEDVPGFVNIMLQYFTEMDELQKKILQLIAIGLKLKDTNYLVNSCQEQHENLRLLHYPRFQVPVPIDNKDAPSWTDNHDLVDNPTTHTTTMVQRGAIHTDFGTITLLIQDDVGGLRVQDLDGRWIDVPPVPYSIIVNVGDMLQRWTNDVLRATPHQVIATMPTSSVSTNDMNDENDDSAMVTVVDIPERYSIAFFCNADKHVMLECLEECLTTDNPIPKYEPINAHEYITKRLSETISASNITN